MYSRARHQTMTKPNNIPYHSQPRQQIEEQPIVDGQPSLLGSQPPRPEQIRYTGIIKLFNEMKGYGFIIWNNQEIYFNKNSVKQGSPKPGTKVLFSMAKGQNSDLVAVNVRY